MISWVRELNPSAYKSHGQASLALVKCARTGDDLERQRRLDDLNKGIEKALVV